VEPRAEESNNIQRSLPDAASIRVCGRIEDGRFSVGTGRDEGALSLYSIDKAFVDEGGKGMFYRDAAYSERLTELVLRRQRLALRPAAGFDALENVIAYLPIQRNSGNSGPPSYSYESI